MKAAASVCHETSSATPTTVSADSPRVMVRPNGLSSGQYLAAIDRFTTTIS